MEVSKIDSPKYLICFKTTDSTSGWLNMCISHHPQNSLFQLLPQVTFQATRQHLSCFADGKCDDGPFGPEKCRPVPAGDFIMWDWLLVTGLIYWTIIYIYCEWILEITYITTCCMYICIYDIYIYICIIVNGTITDSNILILTWTIVLG